MTDSFRATLHSMVEEMKAAPEAMQPSKFWQDLNRRHAERIASAGIANFKRTLAKDYFTWMRVLPWDPQIRFLVGHLPLGASIRAALGVISPFKHRHIPLPEGFALNFLTRLVWQYARQEFPKEIAALSEPSVGNPPAIRIGGGLVSQDLANSILEYKSIESVVTGTVCELGGGYGRTAFVIASLHPTVRYIMVDIPPALGVAQEYLCQLFPDRKHFRFRPFDNFETVQEEFEASALAFLLPHQLALLPDSTVDLFINISSLHEMRLDQIECYLSEIYRLVRPEGHFYLKAWKVSKIPFEGIVIRESDYPLERWERVYRRPPKIQSSFFETLLRKPKT
ncbi:MAG: putative sugar O-methyltransferase [Mesorhizobium sp.]|uniref:putative sugar O-methyltransferase n=1 Tax=unclassified Mesorhizobium TaxID=325217 RepID=UPI000F75AAA1|nr:MULTISPECIES: putative sugar O-methyltransferase [unclassified Mesorhizobium]AZO69881.1 putative sugar O-methyltransferase [Mesorhizobium sp. M1D.F.Ca.ET.043.01.1.1]RWA88363.1 MAG: putative sugar O-methyltransferase [Mesorhizobium sp.]RWE16432.1 MAG: putative sugar O-methyltransferase [Mesorhizobium sp.]TJW87261.1 MAG: putative sugar O-methyltransferase [Mesorhizobium sp.]